MAILKHVYEFCYPCAAVTMGEIKSLRDKKRPVVWQSDEDGLWVVCTECYAICKVAQYQRNSVQTLNTDADCGIQTRSRAHHWYLGCVICRSCDEHVFYTLVGNKDPRRPKKRKPS